MVNIQSKEVLARLLATENITVVHQNTQTASFNVKDRILTLPLWDDMQNYTYDHLVGHEVAHALYTDGEEWMTAAKEGGNGFQSFLNVVEDARIEKLIQRRYPGLRKPFIKSYKKMLADGFFGKDENEINSFKLIDRLNVFFKCGQTVGVQFDQEENAWIREIEKVETFEEVVDIAKRLYGKAVEEQEQEQEAISQAMAQIQSEDYGDEEESSNDSEYGSDQNTGSETNMASEGDDEEETSPYERTSEKDDQIDLNNQKGSGASSNDDPDTSGEQKPDTSSGHEGGTDWAGPESITDKNLSDNITKEFGGDPNTTFVNINLNLKKNLYTDRIVDYKKVLAEFDEYTDAISFGQKKFKQFQINNKKTINYLVKEFEMKKKAAEYKRATVSKTGVLDTLKMNNYMFSDDVFKKMTVVPEGKSHGLMMFVDWSGSMNDQLKHTIDQLLNLVMFCKQVQIPFEVYAFSDKFASRGKGDSHDKFINHQLFAINDASLQDEFRLLELFSSKMSRTEFQTMASGIIAVSNYWDNRYDPYTEYYNIPHSMWLGGTPLDDAILSAFVLHDIFKNNYRLDIVNTVFLSDGASHALDYQSTYKNSYGQDTGQKCTKRVSFQGYWEAKTLCYITNPVLKKRYRFDNKKPATPQLLKMLREHTGSNVIGFHILPSRKPQAMREIPTSGLDWQQREQLWDNMRKDKFCLIPEYGYSAYFGVLGGKNLATSNGAIEVADDASKAVIRTAFKKANSGRKTSRIMLSKFIDIVA